jgi:hypothetical protein
MGSFIVDAPVRWLVIQPNGWRRGRTVGVHWHIDADVEYLSPDPRAQEIDYVSVRHADGSSENCRVPFGYPTGQRARTSPVSSPLRSRRMNCIDCHNRVGHDLPSASRAVDDQISAGNISTTLPYIKARSAA